jgi:hypothetical protein
MCRLVTAHLALVGVLLLALSLSACGGSVAVSATPVTTLETPTPTPPATATTQTIGVTVAALGGSVQAFYTKYGTQADNLFDVNGVTFSLNDDTGADGTAHVFEMLVYPSDNSPWTLTQAEPICAAFLPPDAVFSRSTTTSDGNSEDVYTSEQARASFGSTSRWYSADGSVDIRYQRPVNGASGIYQCSLDLGIV